MSEAGWLAVRDHIAIAYTLARRWRNRNRRDPLWTFEMQIRRYCAGLDVPLHRRTERMRWIGGLARQGVDGLFPGADGFVHGSERSGIARPQGFPAHLDWQRVYLPRWRTVQHTAAHWQQMTDTSNGAVHWGGWTDAVPAGATVVADYGKNRFYTGGEGR